jgi:hypothetical protein
MESFPFYCGCSLYGDQWKPNEKWERRTDWWWYDRDAWRSKFRRYAGLRVNGIAFWHGNPFPALVDYPEFPEARYFSPEESQNIREQFRWIISAAKEYGIRVYVFNWNILLPPGFREAHNLPEFGADTELTRRFRRSTIRRLCELYPDLGGVGTMTGENPVGCVDFVREGIVGGLSDAGSKQTFIHFSWCSYPPESKVLVDAYPGESLVLHYLQYETLFAPICDPRVGRWSEAVGKPMMALGGTVGCTWFTFFGNPGFAHGVLGDLVSNNGGNGFMAQLHAGTQHWYNEMSWCRQAYDPVSAFDDDLWIRRFADRYGSEALAEQLYPTMNALSLIPMRFVHLVHSQTDHYRPQTGLPFVNYLGMPTINSYVFENHTGITKEGWLAGHMGLTWPNPDWGINVVSATETARLVLSGDIVAGASTALEIATELESLARKGEHALENLPPASKNPEELESLLAQMRFNILLGRHYAARIRASVAWELFKLDHHPEAKAREVHRLLSESVKQWEALCDVTASDAWRSLCGVERHTWRSEVHKPPPWDHFDLWRNYRFVRATGDRDIWRENLDFFRKELFAVEARLRLGAKNARLPLAADILSTDNPSTPADR